MTGGLLVLWMEQILSVWISPDYGRRYASMFGLLVVGYGLLSLSRPGHQTLTGMGRMKFTSLVYLGATIAMLAGVYALSLRFGLYGAAAANSAMVLLLIYDVACYRLLGSTRATWKAMAADLHWGFLVPGASYGLLFLNHTILFKARA